MGSPLERRQQSGRRSSDNRDMRALRGLLHDLGHEITTLSYLVEAVRGDAALPDDSRYRLELLALEMTRLLDIIHQGLSGDIASPPEAISLRGLATQLTELAQLGYQTDVMLQPGADARADVNPLLLWRVLSNLVDNAIRAAGPSGHVTLAVRDDDGPVIEVIDDGAGFGTGPAGTASLGLEVVNSLLESCDGSLTVASPAQGGTTIMVRLKPARAARPAAAPVSAAAPVQVAAHEQGRAR